MPSLPPLAALRAFEAAARHLSFKRAAEELGVTPTAISHQVRLLEETLGTRLFERLPRRVVLTRTGQDLWPALQSAFASMAEAVHRIRHEQGRSAITLSATRALTAKWLIPRLTDFARTNPGVDLRLHASDDVVDLHTGAADAAIRYGRAPFRGLVAEYLFEERFAPICSPVLQVRAPEDLAHQTLLHSEWRNVDELTPSWRRWRQFAGLQDLNASAGPTFTDDSHLVQATVAGQGVALLSPILVSDELARGLLVQPFGPTLPGHRYYLVHTSEPRRAETAALLKRWLLQGITACE